MTNKEYFFQEMKLSDDELEKLWEFYQENVRVKDGKDICPMRVFDIEYQFSTIGTAKIVKFGDKRFLINEDDVDLF